MSCACSVVASLQLWQPGEYIRWYIDGTFVYGERVPLRGTQSGRHLPAELGNEELSGQLHKQTLPRCTLPQTQNKHATSATTHRPSHPFSPAELNKEALRAQSNGSYTVPERLIPVEPMCAPQPDCRILQLPCLFLMCRNPRAWGGKESTAAAQASLLPCPVLPGTRLPCLTLPRPGLACPGLPCRYVIMNLALSGKLGSAGNGTAAARGSDRGCALHTHARNVFACRQRSAWCDLGAAAGEWWIGC